jgi:uncharacterized protein YukE
MAQLHMEVDACQQNSQRIQQTKEQVETQWQAQTAMVNSMVGSTWVAPAADQFLNDYQQWEQAEKAQLQKLMDLKQRLDTEIVQWIDTGSKLA